MTKYLTHIKVLTYHPNNDKMIMLSVNSHRYLIVKILFVMPVKISFSYHKTAPCIFILSLNILDKKVRDQTFTEDF